MNQTIQKYIDTFLIVFDDSNYHDNWNQNTNNMFLRYHKFRQQWPHGMPKVFAKYDE